MTQTGQSVTHALCRDAALPDPPRLARGHAAVVPAIYTGVTAMVADGMSVAEILDDFPYLEAEDVAEALRYAAEAVRERELPLRHPA